MTDLEKGKPGLAATLLAALALTACATSGTELGSTYQGPDSITYETGPCFGACPVYRVTVTAAGEGIFEGRRFTAAEGERRFTLSRAQYDNFVHHLAPLRPRKGSVRYAGEACAMSATDMPSAEVEWRRADGQAQQLYFYFGCDMEKNIALAERLRTAPDLLPIARLIRND